MASKKDKKKVPQKEEEKKASKPSKKEAPETTDSKYPHGDPRRLFESPVIANLRAKYGKTVGTTGNKPPIPRLSSGISALDKSLGGGWAKGYWHTLVGPPSSSKTTTLYRAFGMAQRTCRNCNVYDGLNPGTCQCGDFVPNAVAYIRLEDYDPAWARRFFDLDNLALFEPNSLEEGMDVLDGLVRSGVVDVIGLDSIAFMTPEKEIEKSTGDDLVGQQARKIGVGVRKTNSGMQATSRHFNFRPTVFLTNQIRYKVGVMFGSPETLPGGMAPQFAAGTEVRFFTTDYKQEEKDPEKIPFYGDFSYRITKNKTGVPRVEGVYRMSLRNTDFKRLGEVMDEAWLIDQALANNIIEKADSSPIHTLFDERYRGKGHLEETLCSNRELYWRLRDTLMAFFERQTLPQNPVMAPTATTGLGGEGDG